MASQPFPNQYGTLVAPLPLLPAISDPTNATLDAAGESAAGVGYLLLSTGPGTSKTISAGGGGKIHWRTGAITFANAGTTVRVGINDVGATGLEDGTHDVHKDLVGGTDTITANVVNTATMGTGTKTIAHGDLVAIVVEMTARAGADSVTVVRNTATSALPYCTADTGSGPAKVATLPILTIEFDDGTVGWFSHSAYTFITDSSAAFGSGSTPDEYALVFRLPFAASAIGIHLRLGSLAATDDFEAILYSAPLSATPVAERPIAQDMDLAALSVNWDRGFATPYALAPNTDYAIALRPTTTNTLTFGRVNFNTGNGNLRKATMLGTNWSMYSRTDNTGAFGSQDLTVLPMFGVWLSAFDDGVSAGGSGGVTVVQRSRR